MNSRWLIPTIAAVMAFTAGYLQSGSPERGGIDEANISPASSMSSQPSESSQGNLTIEGRRIELKKQLRLASNSPSRAHQAHDFVELFASMDLEALKLAAQLINEVPSFCRSDAKEALMLRLVEIDPQEARQFVEHAESENDNLTYGLMQAWRQKESDAALLWFTNPERGFGRDFQAAFLFRNWPKADLDHAVVLVLSAPKQFGQYGIDAVFSRLAAEDPGSAMTRAQAVEDAKAREYAMRSVMKTWAGLDPESALRWFDQVSDESLRADAAAALSAGLFSKDPGRAMEIARTMPEGPSRDDALAGLVEAGLHGLHREKALELLSKIPFEKNGKAQGIYSSWFYEDAAAAVNHLFPKLDSSNPDSDERQAVQDFLSGPLIYLMHGKAVAKAIGAASGSVDEFRGSLLEKCASHWGGDNQEARAWAMTLPEGAPRNRALAGAMQTWAWQSLKEAGEWIDQQPSSPMRDAAISGFVKGGLSRDPVQALERMRTINDEALRLSSLQEGWKYWHTRDRPTAEKWRDSSADLTASERAYLSRSQ